MKMSTFSNSSTLSCFLCSILKYFFCSIKPSHVLLFSSLSSNNCRGNCYWQTMKTCIGTNNWSMVDHMMSAVCGYVLLDRDLRNMVNLVVNLNTNLMNNRGSSNCNRGSMGNSWSRSINSLNKTMSK